MLNFALAVSRAMFWLLPATALTVALLGQPSGTTILGQNPAPCVELGLEIGFMEALSHLENGAECVILQVDLDVFLEMRITPVGEETFEVSYSYGEWDPYASSWTAESREEAIELLGDYDTLQ